jgi:hypothetical protein
MGDENGAGLEKPRTQPRSLRVMPDSDVTCTTKSMTNAGTSAAAGVVSGALPGRQGESSGAPATAERPSGANCSQPSSRSQSPAAIPPNAVEGECGPSRSRGRRRRKSLFESGDWPARQWAVVDALTGGAGCEITTKGLTGISCLGTRVRATCRRRDHFAIAGPGRGASGHARSIRKDRSPVAANGRRTLGVCTHAAVDANGFSWWWVVWIGGGVLWNGVTAAPIARDDR